VSDLRRQLNWNLAIGWPDEEVEAVKARLAGLDEEEKEAVQLAEEAAKAAEEPLGGEPDKLTPALEALAPPPEAPAPKAKRTYTRRAAPKKR
jgi:hypothetical protein